MKGIVFTNIFFVHILLAFTLVHLKKSNLCILGIYHDFDWNTYMVPPWGIISNNGRIYISNYRYSDMKGIIFTDIIFADFLLVIPLVKFDQLGTCVNILQADYDSNTCMLVSWGIISKGRCITSAIVDTPVWKILYLQMSILSLSLSPILNIWLQ